MALEAVVFPQDLSFPHNGKDISNNYNFIAVAEEDTKVLNGMHANWDHSSSSWSSSIFFPETEDFLPVSLSPKTSIKQHLHRPIIGTELTGKQRKRRRVRSFKNKEEVENQRMTHIAVERNRRKQMNEYLASLRRLMPPSYVQRGDQASIIGGAINFVKQLEQLQQSLEAQKLIKQRCNNGDFDGSTPFADHFTFPQYSSASSCNTTDGTSNGTATSSGISNETIAERRSASADIEVTIVEGHANIKILAKRRPKQLVKLIVGLHNLCLSTLHLNVTAVEHFVLYCFSLKVEEECQCGTVDDIATAVHHLVAEIQEQAELV